MAFFKSCFPQIEMKLKIVVPACIVSPSARTKINGQWLLLFEKYIIKNNRTGKYFPVVIRQIACQTFLFSPNLLIKGMFFLDPDLVSIPQNQEFGF
jgi:hypothetical protein